MSDITPVEQLKELQDDIEYVACKIRHAIGDAIASVDKHDGTIEDDECLENDVDEARHHAENMKQKMRSLIDILERIRETSGEEEE